MKVFNTTGVCIPSKHYMVDLSQRVREIIQLVDAGKYFTINRARQYGKTTTLHALRKALQSEYEVVSLDFQGLSNASFQSERAFCKGFTRLILGKQEFGLIQIPERILNQMDEFTSEHTDRKLLDLMLVLRRWCAQSQKPVVLLIDEVDSATNNQVFLDFLAQLRDGYISRDTDGIPTFQSVILAGVTDIRFLRSKIRDDETHRLNSPWNIAADFNIDMSLSEGGIRGMLDEYEADHHTGMDAAEMAKQLRAYTDGYPFLVSRLCQLMDEQIAPRMGPRAAWTRDGLEEAVRLILAENNTLFQSLTKNLNNYPNLRAALRRVLMEGIRISFSGQQEEIVQLQMYGLIKNDRNTVRIANRIFETMLYNLFLSDEELRNNAFTKAGDSARNLFVTDGKLNMRLILERFIATYTEVFGPLGERFREKDGREQFLLYLKPIINGTGNYYIEAQTRDQTRTDVIVGYLGQQYIIELKIWRGARYNAEGERQISEYLDYFGLTTGYMLSFNFNRQKKTGVHQVHVGDKVLYEGVL